MKAYRFRLETLLKLRARETEQKAELYAEAMNIRISCQTKLNSARDHYHDLREAVINCRNNNLVGVAQTSFLLEIEDAANIIRQLSQSCDQALKNEEKMRNEFIQARQEEETLKKLRQKGYEKYRREFYKQEDKLRDSLTAARMNSALRSAML